MLLVLKYAIKWNISISTDITCVYVFRKYVNGKYIAEISEPIDV